MAAEGNGRGVRVRLGLETVHATAVHRGWVTAAFFDERVVIRHETNPETDTACVQAPPRVTWPHLIDRTIDIIDSAPKNGQSPPTT